MNYKIRIFEQVRGDGTKYYMARVDFTRKWFFGLFTWVSERQYIVNANLVWVNAERKHIGLEPLTEAFYLDEAKKNAHLFGSLESCKEQAAYLGQVYLAEKKKEFVASFKELAVWHKLKQ